MHSYRAYLIDRKGHIFNRIDLSGIPTRTRAGRLTLACIQWYIKLNPDPPVPLGRVLINQEAR
jgi:hypothetical protein